MLVLLNVGQFDLEEAEIPVSALGKSVRLTDCSRMSAEQQTSVIESDTSALPVVNSYLSDEW